MAEQEQDMYFSVDIETDGESPGSGSMLSIGIVALHPETLGEVASFYRTLKRLPGASTSPRTMDWWDGRLEYYAKAREGAVEPAVAVREMHDFVSRMCSVYSRGAQKRTPVFVAYPASFDFSFVYYYCHRYLGESIFSFSALDMKSYAMGLLGCGFLETTKSKFLKEWQTELPITHHALDDARAQAEQFRNMYMWRKAQPSITRNEGGSGQ